MSVSPKCRARVPHKGFPQKRLLQECPTDVLHESGPQEFPTRASPTGASHNSVSVYRSPPQECSTRASRKSVSRELAAQQCSRRVPLSRMPTGARQECPTRASHKSVGVVQDCVPHDCPSVPKIKGLHERFAQEFSTRAWHERVPLSFPQQCSTRASPTRASHKTALHPLGRVSFPLPTLDTLGRMFLHLVSLLVTLVSTCLPACLPCCFTCLPSCLTSQIHIFRPCPMRKHISHRKLINTLSNACPARVGVPQEFNFAQEFCTRVS